MSDIQIEIIRCQFNHNSQKLSKSLHKTQSSKEVSTFPFLTSCDNYIRHREGMLKELMVVENVRFTLHIPFTYSMWYILSKAQKYVILIDFDIHVFFIFIIF